MQEIKIKTQEEILNMNDYQRKKYLKQVKSQKIKRENQKVFNEFVNHMSHSIDKFKNSDI